MQLNIMSELVGGVMSMLDLKPSVLAYIHLVSVGLLGRGSDLHLHVKIKCFVCFALTVFEA